MRQILFAILTMLAVAFTAAADENATLKLKAHVVDGLTLEPVKRARVVLLDAASGDTISKAKPKAYYKSQGGDMVFVLDYICEVPRSQGKYTLVVEHNDYETSSNSVGIAHVGGREVERELPEIAVYRKARQLDEVTVTASKVKFYMNNDTLVYNADAFQLAKGSMLDALIKQLPGVELRDGGQIYVNGKYVESLLLNGKDFFKGDKRIMLNNLGAYTVKNVAVYDRLGERSMLAGQDLGDKEYVMDVRLKREYMSGYIFNAEAGGGTADRYLGRLFGMWYTTRSRLTLVGAINNLNDSRTPGQNDSWSVTHTPGDFRTKMAGLDYYVSARDDKSWEFSGNTTAEHTRSNDITTTDITNFIPSGDTYDNRFAHAIGHNLTLTTDNELKLRPKNKYIYIGQHLDYTKRDRASSQISGTFNQELAEATALLLEQIHNGQAVSLADKTVNTSVQRSSMSGHTMNARVSASAEGKMSYSPDLIGLYVDAAYNVNHYGAFDLYDIRYGNSGRPGTTDYQYAKNAPDHKWSLFASPNYTYIYNDNGSIDIQPRWSMSNHTKDSYLYQLDRLTDMGVFGRLPDNYPTSLNRDQTYFSTERQNLAGVQLTFNHQVELDDDRSISVHFNPSVDYRWRTLDYEQGDVSQKVKKNGLDISVMQMYLIYKTGQQHVKLEYKRNIRQVELNRLVDVTNLRDPLNIFKGATDLKNEADNIINLEWYRYRSGRHRYSERLVLSTDIKQNAIVNGYSYDPATGVRTYQAYNTSGNWNVGLNNYYSKTFGQIDQFTLSSITQATYLRAADMVGSAGSETLRTAVKNTILGQTLGLSWQIGKHELRVNGNVNWRDTRGTRTGFNNFSATNTTATLAGKIVLPYNFELSSDFNVYTRRGYSDPSLNTTDLVWNARLAYSTNGGRWTFMLDGFDLLNQLSNVSYNVNAQGRTETYTNVLPRYALLHVQYRFMIQPKKR
ncbi:hypothetical protein [Paramuribaculum intestinale]|uniref:hypothetical protein n=1 Tax=Paramuribaculum intestinale TaxID=2094151 RepID=UPI00272DCE2B|nr:hypothetical protein [Paramuribaculum intestinale]